MSLKPAETLSGIETEQGARGVPQSEEASNRLKPSQGLKRPAEAGSGRAGPGLKPAENPLRD